MAVVGIPGCPGSSSSFPPATKNAFIPALLPAWGKKQQIKSWLMCKCCSESAFTRSAALHHYTLRPDLLEWWDCYWRQIRRKTQVHIRQTVCFRGCHWWLLSHWHFPRLCSVLLASAAAVPCCLSKHVSRMSAGSKEVSEVEKSFSRIKFQDVYLTVLHKQAYKCDTIKYK